MTQEAAEVQQSLLAQREHELNLEKQRLDIAEKKLDAAWEQLMTQRDQLSKRPADDPEVVSHGKMVHVHIEARKAHTEARKAHTEARKAYTLDLDNLYRLQGAMSVQAGGAATDLQVEILKEAMPTITIDVGGSSSHVKKMQGLIIQEWILSEADCQEIDTSVRQQLGSDRMPNPAPTLDPWDIYTSEAQTNLVFYKTACERINAIYRARGSRWRWNLNPKSTENDNTIPDFVLWSEDGQVVMVGEGKFHSVLPMANLPLMYNNYTQGGRAPGNRASVQSAVAQACGYMQGLRFGFLTTYSHTFFIKYVAHNHYAITKAFNNARVGPSVPEMIFCLAGKSHKEGKVPGTPMFVEVLVVGGPSAPSSAQPPCEHVKEGSSSPPAKVPKTSVARGADFSNNMLSVDALVLKEKLGHGACGVVSLGSLFGQPVAVKCVDACNSKDLVKLLQHEAAMLTHLQDLQGVYVPILRASGFWRGGLLFVLAMSVIRGRHPSPGQETASSKASAVQALKAIHAKGVAHGDIREENILVDDETGKVWFLDFGLSKLDPTPEECEDEFCQLGDIFASDSPSGKSAHGHF